MQKFDKEKESTVTPELEEQLDWKPMSMELIGDIGEVIQGGGGKLSSVGTDPGESRKTKGGA